MKQIQRGLVGGGIRMLTGGVGAVTGGLTDLTGNVVSGGIGVTRGGIGVGLGALVRSQSNLPLLVVCVSILTGRGVITTGGWAVARWEWAYTGRGYDDGGDWCDDGRYDRSEIDCRCVGTALSEPLFQPLFYRFRWRALVVANPVAVFAVPARLASCL